MRKPPIDAMDFQAHEEEPSGREWTEKAALDKLANFEWVQSSTERYEVEEDSGRDVYFVDKVYFSVDDFLKGVDPDLLKDDAFWLAMLQDERIWDDFPKETSGSTTDAKGLVSNYPVLAQFYDRIPTSVKDNPKALDALIRFFDQYNVIKNGDFTQQDYERFHDSTVYPPEWSRMNLVLADLFRRRNQK